MFDERISRLDRCLHEATLSLGYAEALIAEVDTDLPVDSAVDIGALRAQRYELHRALMFAKAARIEAFRHSLSKEKTDV